MNEPVPYQAYTEQFDSCSGIHEVVERVSVALEKLLNQTGILYDTDYNVRIKFDGEYTIQVVITVIK